MRRVSKGVTGVIYIRWAVAARWGSSDERNLQVS